MTECNQQSYRFQELGKRRVEANFEGGYLSRDGGGLFLREIERKYRFMRHLAGCFHDHRNPDLIEHSLEELLRQRIFGLALGYEDLNDHDSLRHDPLLAVSCGKSDPLGQSRRASRDRGRALAGKSTLNRMELAVKGSDARYKKIVAEAPKIESALLAWAVAALPSKRGMIILDFDATDDPLHGRQEGRFYHGYYRHYCYLPLYCFCGNIPLWAQLRTSRRDASDGTIEALKQIVAALRKRFGAQKKILVRADSGFAREQIMAWCEGQKNLYYCLGLARNARLQGELEDVFEELEREVDSGQLEAPCRQFTDFTYSTLTSWSRQRRVVGKAELTVGGRNPRFVVTNLRAGTFNARRLYEDIYCARAEMENQIKVQQMDLFADRTSTGIFDANQLRLWFSAFAHLLIEVLRVEMLAKTSLASASIGQIRLRFFKLAARVKISSRRVLVEWSSACPNQPDYLLAHAALSG